jgi:hypothetical protein
VHRVVSKAILLKYINGWEYIDSFFEVKSTLGVCVPFHYALFIGLLSPSLNHTCNFVSSKFGLCKLGL